MFRKSCVLYGLKTSAFVSLFAITMIAVFSLSPAAFAIEAGPMITSQPVSQTVPVGSTATFSVTASGTGTLTYVWQYLAGSTWKPFGAGTGYNTPTLTTFATTTAYNGLQFQVVVTDGNGLTATSNTATLSVGPAITSQPTNQTVAVGSQATFSVTANGVGTLTYVWQYLAGSTWKPFGAGTGYNTATLTTFATTTAYNGLQFRVVVTDGNGLTANSNTATLSVGPAITSQPTNQTVAVGSTATFSVSANGVGTLTYVWQYLAGSTWKPFGAGTGYNTATLTTFATTTAYNGLQFRVVVTDGNGLTATSNTATLSVGPAITSQPTNQTVAVGSTATFSVTANGVGTLTYAWQYLSGSTWKPFGAGTGYNTATLTTFATTSAYNGLQFRVVVTDGDGLTATSNTATLTVVSALTLPAAGPLSSATVGQEYSAAINVSGGDRANYTWTVNGTPVPTSGTPVAIGTSGLTVWNTGGFTLTIGGLPVTAGSFPLNVSVSDVGTGQTAGPVSYTINVGYPIAAYTVSGTVNYSGSATGWIYVKLTGGSGSPGTAIQTKGAFTIRGVQPGTYTLQAWMDNLGYGVQNASNPTGSTSNIVVTNAGITGASVTLSDPASYTLTTSPAWDSSRGTGAFSGGAFVSFDTIRNSNGIEVPTSYTLEYSTDPTFSTGVSSKSFPATSAVSPNYLLLNGNSEAHSFNPWVVTGLTNGDTYYFRAAGVVGSGGSAVTGPWSGASPLGGMLIGAPSGANAVSGTATFSQAATGPLYVGIYDQNTGSAYVDVITSPVSPQAYSVNVPTGSSYFFFAFLDQNNDGLIDAGDITNTNGYNMTISTVAISGATTQNLTLPSANSWAAILTENDQSLSYTGSPSQSYALNLMVSPVNKLPVAVALLSGADVLAPVDIAECQGCGYNPNDRFWSQGIQLNSTVAPTIGAAYSVQVTYSDGTSETLSPQVTNVVPGLASNLSPAGGQSAINSKPTFTWTDPANAGSYLYQFWLADERNYSTTWSIPDVLTPANGFNSSITSIAWGVDPTGANNPPTVSSLTNGDVYYWELVAYDAYGNRGQASVNYVSGFTPLALPAANPGSLGSAVLGHPYSGSIAASGGYLTYGGGYGGFSVNGTNCWGCTSISLGNGLWADGAWGQSSLTITGTPATTSPVSFTVYVKDASGATAGPVQYTINVLPANTGFPVSGTVSYSGSKTGWVYLALYPTNCGSCNASYGTAIPAPGAFTINGVPDGSYTLQAWMDILGYGVPNASDPSTNLFPNVNVTVSGGALTGVSAALGDPGAVTLSGQPSIGGISAFDGGAFVTLNSPLQNSSGVETPTSYTLQWNTSSSFNGNGGSKSFPANGASYPWIVSGIPDGGPYYFRVQGVAGSSTSSWSANSSAVTIGAPSGGNTVSGTVTLPSTITPTGPLYAGFYDQSTGNVYATEIASPSNSTPNSYSVQVPTGSNYYFFGVVDQNNDGMMGAGSISNVNESKVTPVVITGATTNENLTLTGANAQAMVMTQSNQQTNLSGYTGTSYGIELEVNGIDKLPVAVRLTSAPSYAFTPTDIAAGAFNGNYDEFDYSPGTNGATPSTSDVFSMYIAYSDGTHETPSVSPNAMLSAFATNMSPTWNTTGVSTTPTFTWSYPASAGSYTYQFQLHDSSGNMIWRIPAKHSSSGDFSSSVTPSITWGVDPTGNGSTPSVSSLNAGSIYYWQITTSDAYGDEATAEVSFMTAAAPLTLPASGSVNALVNEPFSQGLSASGGSGAGYVFSVNGNTVPASPSTLTLSDGISATSSGSTLTFSGTPTSAQTISFNVSVEDSQSNTVGPVTYSVNVVSGPSGVNNGNLSGTYVCKFDGFNDNDGSRIATLSSFVGDGNGNFTSGIFDTNNRDYGTAVAGTFTGNYSVGADNNGVATSNWALTSGGTASGSHQYAIALTNATTPAQEFRMVETDDVGSSPSGQHGTSNCYLANTSAFAASTLSGNSFAYGLQGEDAGGRPEAWAGRFTASTESATGGTGGAPGGSITDGIYDGMYIKKTSDGGNVFTGSYTTPSSTTGRFTIAMTQTVGSTQYTGNDVGYIIDANRMFLLETVGDGGMQAGDMRTQLNTSTYTVSNQTGSAVTYEQGWEYSDGAVSGYDSILLQATSNGTGSSTVNASYQDENGTYQDGKANGSTSTLTFDSSNLGRATVTVNGSTDTMYAYFFNAGSAFEIDFNGSEGYLATGWTEPQSQSTFTSAAVAGNYLFGQLPRPEPTSNGNVGEFDLTSSGSVTGGVSTAGEGDFSWDQSLSMTYSWDTSVTGTGSFLIGSGSKGMSCIVISSTRDACIFNADDSPSVAILEQ